MPRPRSLLWVDMSGIHPQEGTPPRRYTPMVLTSSGGRRSGHILPDAFLLFNHFKFDKEAFKRNMQPVLFHNSNFEKRFIHSVEFIFEIWLTYSNAGVMTVIWFSFVPSGCI